MSIVPSDSDVHKELAEWTVYEDCQGLPIAAEVSQQEDEAESRISEPADFLNRSIMFTAIIGPFIGLL
ncbi:MAG: hypothetical protein N2C12_09700, partial [Planctomycetales bacterium]